MLMENVETLKFNLRWENISLNENIFRRGDTYKP